MGLVAEDLKRRLAAWRLRCDRARADWERARATLRREDAAAEACAQRTKDLAEARGIAQAAAQEVQTRAHRAVARVASRCLRAVMDDPYELRIAFERRRGRTEARISFARDGAEVDPTTAAGGGAVDVAAFALRLACLRLSRPRMRPLLVLDEPLRHLSRELRPRAAALIEALCAETGAQVVMTTHDRALRVGAVVDLTPPGGAPGAGGGSSGRGAARASRGRGARASGRGRSAGAARRAPQ